MGEGKCGWILRSIRLFNILLLMRYTDSIELFNLIASQNWGYGSFRICWIFKLYFCFLFFAWFKYAPAILGSFGQKKTYCYTRGQLSMVMREESLQILIAHHNVFNLGEQICNQHNVYIWLLPFRPIMAEKRSEIKCNTQCYRISYTIIATSENLIIYTWGLHLFLEALPLSSPQKAVHECAMPNDFVVKEKTVSWIVLVCFCFHAVLCWKCQRH